MTGYAQQENKQHRIKMKRNKAAVATQDQDTLKSGTFLMSQLEDKQVKILTIWEETEDINLLSELKGLYFELLAELKFNNFPNIVDLNLILNFSLIYQLQ